MENRDIADEIKREERVQASKYQIPFDNKTIIWIKIVLYYRLISIFDRVLISIDSTHGYYYDKKGVKQGIRNIILPFKRYATSKLLSPLLFRANRTDDQLSFPHPSRGIQLKLIISKDQLKIHSNEFPRIRYY